MNTMTTLAPEKRSTPRTAATFSGTPVLRVEGLEVTYYTDLGRAKALDSVSFTLQAGEKLGMVGESGSGKSTMALAMMRMIKPPGRIEAGKVYVGNVELMGLDEEGMRKSRLNRGLRFIEPIELPQRGREPEIRSGKVWVHMIGRPGDKGPFLSTTVASPDAPGPTGSQRPGCFAQSVSKSRPA